MPISFWLDEPFSFKSTYRLIIVRSDYFTTIHLLFPKKSWMHFHVQFNQLPSMKKHHARLIIHSKTYRILVAAPHAPHKTSCEKSGAVITKPKRILLPLLSSLIL